jgi:hypothetical protein
MSRRKRRRKPNPLYSSWPPVLCQHSHTHRIRFLYTLLGRGNISSLQIWVTLLNISSSPRILSTHRHHGRTPSTRPSPQLIPAFSGGIVETENYVRQGAKVEQLICGKAIRCVIVTQCPQIGTVDSGHRATRVQMGHCRLGHIR